MGIGQATGENRALNAVKQAIQSPLLETSINGARGVLVNITGGISMGIHEVNEAAKLIEEAADPEANLIYGANIDEALGDTVKITVIATGFGESKAKKPEGEVAESNEKKPESPFDFTIPSFLNKK